MSDSELQVDPKRYGRLLARKLPAVIRTEEENERLIAELEQFDRRYDELTPEEREYSELLTVLIEAFEGVHYAVEGSTSGSRLRSLMEEHGLRQRDLLGVFGFPRHSLRGCERQAGNQQGTGQETCGVIPRACRSLPLKDSRTAFERLV